MQYLYSYIQWKAYNNNFIFIQIDCGDDIKEEFGWKLVHGDVFRPPRRGMLLSVFVGSGIQVLCMTVVTLGKFYLVIFKLYSF